MTPVGGSHGNPHLSKSIHSFALRHIKMAAACGTRANYPSRPITMVVPFAAGGGLDVLGRILAARMSEILGHQVIVENATGAAGIVGVKRVVNAAPVAASE
jgi:tripartite-type tricarboxylate transporter receptor subunit TctC